MKKLSAIMLANSCLLACLAFPACDSSYDRYDNSELYKIGNFTYEAAQVSKIEIDWAAGSIEIEQGSSETLFVRENTATHSDTEKMHYYLDGRTLKIEYCSSGYKGKINASEKNLQLEIPSGVELEIDTEKASLTMGNVSLSSLSIDNGSGSITGENWTVERDVDVETTSGYVTLGGLTAQSFDFEGKSGNFSIEKANLSVIDGETGKGSIKLGILGLCSGSLETTSGDITLTLLDGAGLSALFKTFTGKLKTEKEYDHQNRYLFAGENAEKNYWQIKVDTVGGDLIVQ